MEQRKQNTEMAIYDTTAKFARAEKATLEKLLRAKGYYQADVSFRIENDRCGIVQAVVPSTVYAS